MVRRALVTGITGQVGSYLSELLIAKGYEVAGTCRRSSTPSAARIEHVLDDIDLHECDLTDQASLYRLIDEVRPSEIYNLAAQSSVATSWNQVTATGDVTGLAVGRLLEAIRCVDPSIRFFQASSSEMFGEVDSPLCSEQTPFRPRSPYGVAKLYGHQLTVSYRSAYGMFACCGIAFNQESPRRGFEFVTRKITRAAARIKLGLQDELRLGNMQVRRDWGYACDFVDAMWRMLQQDEPADFVIGTGVCVSVWDFAKQAFDQVGLDPFRYIVSDEQLFRPSDQEEALRADARAANEQLGWRPETSLAELVELMVDNDMALAEREAAEQPRPAIRRAA